MHNLPWCTLTDRLLERTGFKFERLCDHFVFEIIFFSRSEFLVLEHVDVNVHLNMDIYIGRCVNLHLSLGGVTELVPPSLNMHPLGNMVA